MEERRMKTIERQNGKEKKSIEVEAKAKKENKKGKHNYR